MSEAHDEQIVVATSSPTLGDRLKQAREAKKYSIAEVAAQLRLTKETVIYMETAQWDKLNGRTYARGYFSSYVKFLGLPFEEMLAVFNDEYTLKEPGVNLLQHGLGQDDKPFPWFMLALIAIVILVIGLAFQQWQQTQDLQQSSLTETEEVEEDDTFTPSIVDPLEQQSTLQPKVDPTLAEDSQTAEALGTSENNLDEIIAMEAVSTAAEIGQKDSGSMVPPTQESTALPQDESTLQLSFTGECWVEVTNADSQVLVSKVMRADQSLLLKSEQPLSVLLGRADVASVSYNGASVDLAPHKQGDVARLTLGVES
ncbi:RodZ domain-containing protein [Methylophaga sp.]|uniref:RodZ domain-containing protein n=1 Tax=Methylophaga sp. TaxID=2024840 RepID=UPI003F69784D